MAEVEKLDKLFSKVTIFLRTNLPLLLSLILASDKLRNIIAQWILGSYNEQYEQIDKIRKKPDYCFTTDLKNCEPTF